MTIILSPQQDAAVLGFRDWYKSLPERVFTHSEQKYDEASGEYYDVPCYSRGLDKAPFFLLEGFAGTGKSTVLPRLVEATGLEPHQIAFAAPTGKAAKVMTKKLHQEDVRAMASTIHRAIYRPKAMQAYQIEQDLFRAQAEYKAACETGNPVAIRGMKQQVAQIEKNLERAYDENAPQFQLDVESPTAKNAHLFIIDECSMVDENMAEDIRSFGVPVLAIGDPGQLPPIAAGPGFCVRKPDAALTEIHRQALDNPIIWASMLIREGEQVPMGSHGGGLLRVIDREDDDVTYDLDRDVQIIVGTHERRWQITRKLRKLCGFGGSGPCEGELMMITKNSRLYPSLVNGTMAVMTADVGDLKSGNVTYVSNVRDEDGKDYTLKCLQATIEEHYRGKNDPTAHKRDVFRAKNDERVHELDYAYAITCHKAQGSQWDECAVHDQSSAFRKDAQKWLYTATTRAAERLTIIV